MDSPIFINWMSPLSFLGVLGVIFIFFSSHFSMKFLCANRIAPEVKFDSRKPNLFVFVAALCSRSKAICMVMSEQSIFLAS